MARKPRPKEKRVEISEESQALKGGISRGDIGGRKILERKQKSGLRRRRS